MIDESKIMGTVTNFANDPNKDDIIRFYELYSELLEKYHDKIKYIWDYNEALRKERLDTENTYIEIREKLKKANFPDDIINEQMNNLMNDMKSSFDSSQKILDSFYIKNYDEFHEYYEKKFLKEIEEGGIR